MVLMSKHNPLSSLSLSHKQASFLLRQAAKHYVCAN